MTHTPRDPHQRRDTGTGLEPKDELAAQIAANRAFNKLIYDALAKQKQDNEALLQAKQKEEPAA